MRNITTLCQDGHENVVQVLDHGWLNAIRNGYYIDMELCDLTLSEYIDYQKSIVITIDTDLFGSSLANNDCEEHEKVLAMWAICTDIAQGLEFIHLRNTAHRDLKPSNGISHRSLLMVVLYSGRNKLWKLSDFGISAEATSKRDRVTYYAKGTSSYRAPELLRAQTFTNKVDIWALGCILYEVATGRQAFAGDWSVLQYSESKDSSIETTTIPLSGFWVHHIKEVVRELLHKQKEERPRASKVVQIVSSYCQIPVSIVCNVGKLKSYPRFSEWRSFIEEDYTEGKIVRRFLEEFKSAGEWDVAIVLLKHMDPAGEVVSVDTETTMDHASHWKSRSWGAITTPASIRTLISAVKKKPDNLQLRIELADAYLKMGKEIKAAGVYEDIVGKISPPYWVWHKLADIHLQNNPDKAVNLCKIQCGVSAGMILSSLHAIHGHYDEAIRTYVRLGGYSLAKELRESMDYLRSFCSKDVTEKLEGEYVPRST